MVYGKLVNGNFFNIMDTFHSTETFGLNFQRLTVANGRAFSKLFQKRGQPHAVSQSFQKFLPETFFFI